MPSEPDSLRAAVRLAYARALERAGEAGSAGNEVNLPGYTWREAALVPACVVAVSFGCGNPLASAEVREGQVVLDVGCGAGMDVLLAARRVGPSGRVVGIDMTAEMAARARSNTAGFANVAVVQALMEELPLGGGSVDWVICNGALSLSPEKGRALAEIRRVLRSGGHAVLSDLALQRPPGWGAQRPLLGASCLMGALTEEGYLAALAAAGLDACVRRRRPCGPAEVEAVVRAELGQGGPSDAAAIAALTRELHGRVALLTLTAAKPA